MKDKKEGEKTAVKELSMEHERFCFLYSRCLNATKAYMEVYPDSGYNSARANSSRLITDDNIKERIGILCAEQDALYQVSPEDVKRDLARLYKPNIRDFYDGEQLKPMGEMDPNFTFAIKSIEYETINTKDGPIGMTTKITLHDKIRPLELLGKTHKMFTDKTEITGKDGQNLILEVAFGKD